MKVGGVAHHKSRCVCGAEHLQFHEGEAEGEKNHSGEKSSWAKRIAYCPFSPFSIRLNLENCGHRACSQRGRGGAQPTTTRRRQHRRPDIRGRADEGMSFMPSAKFNREHGPAKSYVAEIGRIPRSAKTAGSYSQVRRHRESTNLKGFGSA